MKQMIASASSLFDKARLHERSPDRKDFDANAAPDGWR